MIITTAGRTDDVMVTQAKEVANALKGTYINRQKQSVSDILSSYEEDVLVVGKNRLQLYDKEDTGSFFFHPNSASFRVKRLLRGEQDPFIETAGLTEGMSLLDCTLGLASDSIVASSVVGETGKVIGVEYKEILAFLAKEGLQSWQTDVKQLEDAMRSIQVVCEHHLTYLKSSEDKSFDVVYFDPMFEQSILESDGITGIKAFAHYEDLLDESIKEAKRVAKKRVVLKDHYQSERFNRYGFQQFIRKTAKFHYGRIEIAKNEVAF